MKKLISLILVFIMLNSTIVVSTVHVNAAKSGDFEYEILKSGKVEITGYTGSKSKLVIPNKIVGRKVVSLGMFAFLSCSSIKSVFIPKGITKIEENAFANCENIKSIKVSSKNKNFIVENNALYDKKKTRLIKYAVKRNTPEFVIPESVKAVESSAFEHCETLKKITIPNGVKRIGDSAFDECYLTELVIPDSVKEIGISAFAECSFTELKIPKSVKKIGNAAFFGNSFLEKITIPDNIKDIGDGVFTDTAYYYNKSNWEEKVLYLDKYLLDAKDSISGSYSVKQGTRIIAGGVFYQCEKLKSIKFPSSLEYIGEKSFIYCDSLKKVSIPESVKALGKSAFCCCKNLKSVKLNKGLKTVKSGAFYDCKKLKKITIPKSVTKIKPRAFGYYHGNLGKDAKIKNFTVRGYKNSAAEKYAKANGFKFKKL